MQVALLDPSAKSDVQLSPFEISEDRLYKNYVILVIGWGNNVKSESDEYKELYSAMFKIIPSESCQTNINPIKMDDSKICCANKK